MSPALHASRLVPLLFAAFALASCAFNAAYDPLTDKNVNEISVKTETALAKADLGRLSAAEQHEYFAESLGLVRATQMRAATFSKNEEETIILSDLERQLMEFDAKGWSLRRSLAGNLNALILDLQTIQTTKKRSAKAAGAETP